MIASEELATFLSLRGHCLLTMGKVDEGIAAQEAALRFAPNSHMQRLILAEVKTRYRPQDSPLALLPPEQRELLWPKPRTVNVQLPNVPGVAPVVPSDANPLKTIRNP